MDRKVTIVFLTNYDNFVFEGYEVGAFRYLMKSEVAEKLDVLLNDVSTEREQKKDYILVRTGGGEERLELSGIIYLEADRHDTVIHTTEGEKLLKLPISKLAGLLPER